MLNLLKYCYKWLLCKYYIISFKLKFRKVPISYVEPVGSNYIVSLTSYGVGLEKVHLTIQTILEQTSLPEKIILWLDHSYQFNKKNLISNELQYLNNKNLCFEIRYTDDVGPYTKIIPAMKAFPRANIISADDDIIYPRNWAKDLMKAYSLHPNAIICHGACRILWKNDNLEPYLNWPLEPKEVLRYDILPLGCWGVLYAKNETFFKKLANEMDSAQRICPKQDDLWLRHMSMREDMPVFKVGNYEKIGIDLGRLKPMRLEIDNLKQGGGNDVALRLLEKEWVSYLKFKSSPSSSID